MHHKREIAQDLYWIGGDDSRQLKFEGIHPTPNGMSYNSYLLLDDKAVLIDAIDRALEEHFFNELDCLLRERRLDYIVVSHMEPDHTAILCAVAMRHPDAEIVCTSACKAMISQFFDESLAERVMVVGDGDTLNCGTRTLAFAKAPMVHWPEVMVTYDIQDKILFSADAFGSFGTLDGQLCDDSYDLHDLLPEMRRYYACIVGKYGTQVAELLAKARALDIQMIAPLHGHVLKRHVEAVLEVYGKWAMYEPEAHAVAIVYASAYGGTREAAETLAFRLSDRGLHDIALFDLSVDDVGCVLAEAFRVSNLVLASITYNAGMHPAMAALLADFAAHNLRDRKYSIIQNGSWGPAAGRYIQRQIEGLAGWEMVGDMLTIKSRLKLEQYDQLDKLAERIIESLGHPVPALAYEVTEVFTAELPLVAGAKKAPGPIPVHPGVHVGAPTAPPPVPGIGSTDGSSVPSNEPAGDAPVPGTASGKSVPSTSGQPSSAAAEGSSADKPAGESLRERSMRKIGRGDGPQIIQVWRCSFCGMQIELPKGMMTDDYQCPQCFKRNPGLFFLVREKVVS